MKRLHVIGLVGFTVLTGCATNHSELPGELVAVEHRYGALRQHEAVQKHAPVALYELSKYIRDANRFYSEENEAEYEHSLYLANRHADVVDATARKGQYEEEIRLSREEKEDLVRAQLALALQQQKTKTEKTHDKLVALAQKLKHVESKLTERGTVLSLQDILFEFDEAELKPGAERSIEQLASFLKENADTQIMIEGFTDALGEEAYNKTLSLQRAEAVRAALARHGVNTQRMKAKGLGEAYPVATNEDAVGRQQNRRVEIVFSDSAS